MSTAIVNATYLAANGHTYTVIAIANTAGAPSLTPATVVYKNQNGDMFTRPLRSWGSAMEAVS